MAEVSPAIIVEREEFFQICSVPYGVDPDGEHAKVIDTMSVRCCDRRSMQFARSLRTQRQGEREDEFVFIRKVRLEVRRAHERVG